MALPKEVKSSVIFCLLAKKCPDHKFHSRYFRIEGQSCAHTCWQTCRRSVSTCAESVQGAVGSERLGQTGYLRSSLHSPCQSWFSMVVVTYRTFGGSPSPDVQLIDFAGCSSLHDIGLNSCFFVNGWRNYFSHSTAVIDDSVLVHLRVRNTVRGH